MADINLSEAAKALHTQFGPRLDGQRNEGRTLMADALRDHLNISGRDAKKLVDDLEQARTIQYVADSAPQTSAHGGSAGGGLFPSTYGVGISVDDAGYWQIGAGE